MPHAKKEKVHAVIASVAFGIVAMALAALIHYTFLLIIRSGSIRPLKVDPSVEFLVSWCVLFVPLIGGVTIWLSLSHFLSNLREREIVRTIEPDAFRPEADPEADW